MYLPISRDSGECLGNFMRMYKELKHNGNKIVAHKSSWAGLLLVYEDGKKDLYYIGNDPIKMEIVR